MVGDTLHLLNEGDSSVLTPTLTVTQLRNFRLLDWNLWEKGYTFWWCNQILELLNNLADKMGARSHSHLAGVRHHSLQRYLKRMMYTDVTSKY